MKAVLFQTDVIWGDPAANRARADELLAAAPSADLYVFPEMFTTGFATEPQGIAEEAPSATLDWMRLKAVELDAAILGTVALHEDGAYYNRSWFVKPDGSAVSYDKHHLFTYGGETRYFTPGNEQVDVEWRGVRFRLITCYDLRFPLWCRCHGDYDVLVCLASWPARRQSNFDILLRARAVEDQCYVLGVNRVGMDASNLEYEGGTAAIHPLGHVISECPRSQESFCVCELGMEELQAFRKSFPVLADADPYKID